MRHVWSIVVVFVVGIAGCGGDDAAKDDANAASQAGTGGSTPAEAGSRASGTTGAAPSAGVSGAGAGTGGSRASNAGSPGSAGTKAGAAAGSGQSAGSDGQDDAGSAGQTAPPAVDLPNLNIFSDTSSIEFTPALLAARSFYSGKATVNTGGIADLFSGGRADLATNAETQALRQSASHPELRIVFTVTETFYRIVARRSAGISQLSDLKGKRVATVPNTSAHYYLDLMLRTAGLSAADVTVVSAFPLTRLPDLLAGNQADAATSWEPEPQKAFDRLGSDAIEFQDRSVYREIVNLHATEATLANPEKRRGIVAFVRALIAATQRYRDAPEEVWPLVADATGYEPTLISKVWHNEQFAGTLAPDLLDVLEREEPWVAQQTNRPARGRAELAKLIDDSVLRDAMTGR